jgi:hypothetical protein
MVRHRLLTAAHLLAALPPLVVTGGLAILVCLEGAGAHPLTMGPPRGAAEAVALHDGASAVRLLGPGGDPSVVELIRSGVLLDREVLASALEAAVIVDDAVIFSVLASGRADLPAGHLACLAADVGARSVLARLGGSSTCEAGAAWAAVLDRP